MHPLKHLFHHTRELLKRACTLPAAAALLLASTVAPAATTPNIVIILTDDLGYGDTSCYGATALNTPHIDRLARTGLRFTNAYATAATCTPSRYSLLTGEYAWRRTGTNILPGDARLIIEPGRTTLPAVLQSAGYRTGIVGKWHLGLGAGSLDWNADITPGPLEVGFDYAFIMAATGDRVPCVFVENRRVVGLDPADPIHVRYDRNFPGQPTGKANPELLTVHPSHTHDHSIVNGISRIGYMIGGASALWRDEELGDTFQRRATAFIEAHASKPPGTAGQPQPFFLYYATHEPHVPRVPAKRFVGKSGLGPRGDVILQLDDAVGQVLATLDKHQLTDNTLVIFTSDNGPILDDGYQDQAAELNGKHRPGGPLRGNKYSAYEAGTRVPMLISWPARIKPGVSQTLVSQVDLLASLAALTGQTFDRRTAPDSQNQLSAFLGESAEGRTSVVQQGGPLALRKGDWKYIPPSTRPAINRDTRTETGAAPQPQLFNLAEDPAEASNLASTRPDLLQELDDLLRAIQSLSPVK